MCFFSVSQPKVETVKNTTTGITAQDLVPKTEAPEPESPAYGGTDDTYSKAKGKSALKIDRVGDSTSYNPLSL
jgi:hypothetical protein